MTRDWVQWHEAYEDPTSELSLRRHTVTSLIRDALSKAAAGPIRVLSLCSGDSGDLLDALEGHKRADDVVGAVVELDPTLSAKAKRALRQRGSSVEARCGDAGDPSIFADVCPVNVLVLVGIFGNISATDIETTIATVPSLCVEGASVIWSRHRQRSDLTENIRQWFGSAGCTPIQFESPGPTSWSIGAERVGAARPCAPLPRKLFTFLR